MSAPIDSSGFDRILSQTMQALNQARGAASSNGADPEPVEGFGEGADGQIKVTAALGGKITEVTLDPRVLRMTTVQLSEEVMAAVNGALADLQARIADRTGSTNLDSLAAQLKDVQEQSTREMGTFMQALTDAQERIASMGRS